MKLNEFLNELLDQEVQKLIKDQYYTFDKFSNAVPEYTSGSYKLIIKNSVLNIISADVHIILNERTFNLNSVDISYTIELDDFNSEFIEYNDIRKLKAVYNSLTKLVKSIKFYSYEKVSTGYVLTLNDSKVFKENRFGIVEEEHYVQVMAKCFNDEAKNPTPNIDTGDIIRDIRNSNEGVVVHVVKGTDFENHGMVEVYLTDKKYFEHYTWFQWNSFLEVIEQYN